MSLVTRLPAVAGAKPNGLDLIEINQPPGKEVALRRPPTRHVRHRDFGCIETASRVFLAKAEGSVYEFPGSELSNRLCFRTAMFIQLVVLGLLAAVPATAGAQKERVMRSSRTNGFRQVRLETALRPKRAQEQFAGSS